ncbi:MAG TPA: tyrosine-protein phosphatase [Pseudomonadales bacterium]|mgnify:CR=1 FL=1|jgi:protein-tyrosine phosphatase|nr:hypothetical protein [Gammaproteobacteria bacterium]MDP6024708.1 tyrosine-protein phosphatase [Pseudomonadales bacterium]MDP6315529.1 tyrosine-protein phosphatase [Pseudomonadales bacterium]MDP7313709.1 tyrosine-protein phosphatase [Pseudomonadales bacterium]HJP49816.1 tyrosine-protein phosphatase [Pseudomonadales bacterium]|tara:strand:- start:339 stop:1166 length:828 start_codon:yes stop_codon:yes gene_type:complete
MRTRTISRAQRAALSLVLIALVLGWQAWAQEAYEAANPRLFGFEGAYNFRDVGGYSTRDGQRVKWHLFYRSNAPAEFNEAEYATVGPLGIKTVIDLRTEEQQLAVPTQWWAPNPPLFVSAPIGDQEGLKGLRAQMAAARAQNPPDSTALDRLYTEIYRRMPFAAKAELAKVFTTLTKPGGLPLLVHCSAGKDRTGLAAALVLSLLDVPQQTIYEDYLLTNAVTPAGVPQGGVEKHWLEASLSAIEAKYGDVATYLERELGVTPEMRAAIRANLLD